jgi:hypothetical protein
LEDQEIPVESPHSDILALNEAFEQFAGLQEQEAADVLGISRTTVNWNNRQHRHLRQDWQNRQKR